MPAPAILAADTAPLRSIEELLRADAFPHEVEALSVRETHISWVILTGAFAYKIKKPVQLDFLDASTLERRRRLCEEELRLNRRLAPQLYIDVVAITRRNGRALIGGSGDAVEYAVRMRQFAASDELPALLARGAVDAGEAAALGELLARFHRDAAVAAPACVPEKTERMYDSVLGNLAQLLAHLEALEPALSLGRLVDWVHDSARALGPTFELREREGLVREGHGDLHAANIVRQDGRLLPFDCIEFDPGLRWIDVIDDIAFLVMDLIAHERRDLAFALLSRYLEISGDYHGMRVLPFYAVYRALVRARVDALSAGAVPARAAEFRERLRRRVRAAAGWTAPRQPLLVLMHGASASGKSWLSSRLVPALGAVRIRSDLERKRLAGLAAAQSAAAPAHAGIYSPQFSHRTYGRLADCAQSCLDAGLNVIVDAAFLAAGDRQTFRTLAARSGVPCMTVSCQADPVTLAARLLERSRSAADPSDADLSVLDAQLRALEPFDPAEQACVIAADTSAPDVVRHVSQALLARCAV